MTDANLTERQRKWFASVRASLERDTGKTMAEWVAIARTCPESGHRARLKWLKDAHGLMQNRASQVLAEAFGSSMAWNDPAALIAALWADPAARQIYEALDAATQALEGTVRTARKGYTAWSATVQYAAARPLRGGGVALGLAVPPVPPLQASRNDGWSERLTGRMTVTAAGDVDAALRSLLREAWRGA